MTTAQDAAEMLERAIARLSPARGEVMHKALADIGPQGRWDLYATLAEEVEHAIDSHWPVRSNEEW